MMTKLNHPKKNEKPLLRETVLHHEIELFRKTVRSLLNQSNPQSLLSTKIINLNIKDLNLHSQSLTPTTRLARKKIRPPSLNLARTNHLFSLHPKKTIQKRKDTPLPLQRDTRQSLTTDPDMTTVTVPLQDQTMIGTGNLPNQDLPPHTDQVKDLLLTQETTTKITVVIATTTDPETTTGQTPTTKTDLSLTLQTIQENQILKNSRSQMKTNQSISQWLKNLIKKTKHGSVSHYIFNKLKPYT